MKATLKFDLTDPDDIKAHYRCVRSLDMAGVLFEITHNLKKKIEHRFDNETQDRNEYDGIEETFYEIRKLFNEFNIDTNNLID